MDAVAGGMFGVEVWELWDRDWERGCDWGILRLEFEFWNCWVRFEKLEFVCDLDRVFVELEFNL